MTIVGIGRDGVEQQSDDIDVSSLSSKMQGSATLVVGCLSARSTLEQELCHGVLAVARGDVQDRVTWRSRIIADISSSDTTLVGWHGCRGRLAQT